MPFTLAPASRLRRAADLSVPVGVPVAVFAVVLAVFLGERASIDHELQLIAPAAAPPGGTVALRAFPFERLQAIDGPYLASVPVEVRLVDADGRVRARVELSPALAGGAEGALALPDGVRGALTLEAIARLDGEPVASARAPIEVGADAPLAPLEGRLATELQRLALGPVLPTADPALPLEVRVEGGACIPEQPCRVLVDVGEGPTTVELEPSASVTPSPAPQPVRGLVARAAVVHGPEGRTELVARRQGVEVARRSIQLPVALATPAVVVSERLLEAGQSVRLAVQLLSPRPGVALDVYRDGRWTVAASVAPSGDAVDASILEPGLHRLQVHVDPFRSDRAAVRVVAVREPGETDEAALARVAAALGQPLPPPGPMDLRLAWLTASDEDAMHIVPPPVSGLADDQARLEARRALLRTAALVALALGLLVAAVLFSRRGVEAALQAQRVMDATGDPELTSRQHRRRTLLSALAIVATVLLAFLGAAALIVARGRLLG